MLGRSGLDAGDDEADIETLGRGLDPVRTAVEKSATVAAG
jgi:hypothetical protein